MKSIPPGVGEPAPGGGSAPGRDTMDDIVEDVEPVQADDELSTFLNDLADHVALAVVDADGQVDGIITLEAVAHRDLPVTSKAGTVAQNVRRVGPEVDATEAVQALVSGPYRAVPVVDEDEGYLGLITERSVLTSDLLGEVDRPARTVMHEPMTLEADDPVGKARAIMRDADIGQMPVQDGEELVGVVGWADLLALQRPKSRQAVGDRAGGFTHEDAIAVSSVMDATPVTVGMDTPLTKVVEAMREEPASYALVLEDRAAKGILTCTDLLELLAAQTPKEGVFIQVTGADDLDDFEREKLHQHVDQAARKVASIHGGFESLWVHLKSYHESGSQSKHSVRTRIMTPVGPFFAKAHGFDLAAAVDEAMDRLERQVKEDRERTTDRQHRMGRRRANEEGEEGSDVSSYDRG